MRNDAMMGAKRRATVSRVHLAETPIATSIGVIHAINSGLWCLAVDAAAAAAWRGVDPDDVDNPKSDFGRALRAADSKHGRISVGTSHGVVFHVGGCGFSDIWRIDNGIALLEHYQNADADDKVELGKRVAQLPARGKPRQLGEVTVECGCLALLLPYATGDIPAAEIRAAARGDVATAAGNDRVLVPVNNGVHQIISESLGSGLGYQDDVGTFVHRLRIVPAPT